MTAQTILPANSVVDSSFDVANSARFEGGAPDSLRLAAAGDDGDQKHWTVSMWIKRSKLATLQHVWSWSRNSTNAEGGFAFDTNDQIFFISDGQNGGTNEIDGVFRDTAAWFHLVWACDADNSTNALRWRVYINGVERTITGDPTIQDANGIVNRGSSQEHWIGGRARSLNSNTSDNPFSGYIAEVVFIDDATLGPTSFGEFDDNGIWIPLKSVEDLTFGAKGYYLNFQDSGELGTDVSGNDYDFSETNLTVLDQSIDTCTNNFATINPLYVGLNANFGISEGNLKGLNSGNGENNYVSTIAPSSGKWYFEAKANVAGDNYVTIGIVATDSVLQTNGSWLGSTSDSFFYNENGSIGTNGSASTTGLASYADNDIIGVRVNLDDNELHFYKNGTIITNTALSITANKEYFFGGRVYTNATGWEYNFGSPHYAISSGNADGNGFGNFEYAVPSGYFAICTKNLAEHG